MWIVSIRALGSSLEHINGFTNVLLLAQESLKKDHTHLVHRRCVTQRCSPSVPLHCFDWILLCSAALLMPHLTADGCAVCTCSMTALGCGLVKSESLFGVNLKPEEPLTIA